MKILPPAVHKRDIPHGARVLLRSSLNVPVADGTVAGMFRLEESLRTVRFLREQGARITIIGHLGREGASLAPVHKVLNASLPVSFIPKVTGAEVYAARENLRPGEVLLLENTRTDPREEACDIIFLEELGVDTDLFVFDDFSAAHREHASTVGLIRSLPSCVGVRFYEELTALLRITERMEKPAVAVVSGAKCETKMPLLKDLVRSYDVVFVAGVIANVIFKQKGYSVGKSVVDDITVPDEVLNANNVILPREVIVTRDFIERRTVPIEAVRSDDVIADVGDGFLKVMQYQFENARTIMCNGPLGWYEKGFVEQMIAFSGMVGKTEAYSFIGGGDTVTLLEQQHLLQDWGFVSTGGGSLLTYFAEGSLPVLRAFEEKMSIRSGSAGGAVGGEKGV